jgi:hypothetical protein
LGSKIEIERVFKGAGIISDKLEIQVQAVRIFEPGAIDKFHVSKFICKSCMRFPFLGGTVKIDITPGEEGIIIITVVFPVRIMCV